MNCEVLWPPDENAFASHPATGLSLGAIAASDRDAAIPASVTFPPRFGSHSYRRAVGSRRSGDMVSFPTTRTRSSIANSPSGNLIRQVLLVVLTNSCDQ